MSAFLLCLTSLVVTWSLSFENCSRLVGCLQEAISCLHPGRKDRGRDGRLPPQLTRCVAWGEFLAHSVARVLEWEEGPSQRRARRAARRTRSALRARHVLHADTGSAPCDEADFPKTQAFSQVAVAVGRPRVRARPRGLVGRRAAHVSGLCGSEQKPLRLWPFPTRPVRFAQVLT